ncbi:hypothetical protein B0J11DRAFT_600208 [Dendryphion nanum]|uniref:Uncharacterized protein n=1 Tax=Dendryphion nanum TaxID=256645 RepID=A0A9P9E612_9PLEO|nr:hypothetical protein B0J11DRAFT_600208 [Dendryphion nanum]
MRLSESSGLVACEDALKNTKANFTGQIRRPQRHQQSTTVSVYKSCLYFSACVLETRQQTFLVKMSNLDWGAQWLFSNSTPNESRFLSTEDLAQVPIAHWQIVASLENVFKTIFANVHDLLKFVDASKYTMYLTGVSYFTVFNVNSPMPFDSFLRAINERPFLAASVEKMYLTPGKDDCFNDVYEMLDEVRAELSDSEDSEDMEEGEVAEETTETALSIASDDLFLVSMGDNKGLPESVFFDLLKTLLPAAKNIFEITIPAAWDTKLDWKAIFPHLEIKNLAH